MFKSLPLKREEERKKKKEWENASQINERSFENSFREEVLKLFFLSGGEGNVSINFSHV